MRDNRFGRDRNWRDMEDEQTPVTCKVQSFDRFSSWLDGQLAKLERRWRDSAAPSARQPLSSRSFQCRSTPDLPKPKPR